MITYTKGNLLQANVEALVNTVNTVGVMGKGIALQFKETFSENYKLYKRAAENKELEIGKVFVTSTGRLDGIKWIINFPTKKHWRYPSKLSYIIDGLDDMIDVVKEKEIKSVALPPLGCGNGGLEWSEVKPILESKLSKLPEVKFLVFEPSNIAYDIQATSQRKEVNLTPTRAMILYLMKSYSQLDYSLTVLETQKLVYFLNRLGDPETRRIEFTKYTYGPYAPILNHVLYAMDGAYLKGMKFKDVKTFDPLSILEDKFSAVEEFITSYSTDQQKNRINTLMEIIEGFETPLSMELLSTVDYVMNYEVSNLQNLEEVVEKVYSWNDRKREIMPLAYIQIAHDRLINFADKLYETQ